MTVSKVGVVGEAGVLGVVARALVERGMNVVALAADSTLASLDGCDLVIDQSACGPDAKLALLRRIEARLNVGAVLATNVDASSLDTLASAVDRPAQLLSMRVLDAGAAAREAVLVTTAETAPGAYLTAEAFCRRAGFAPVVADAAE